MKERKLKNLKEGAKFSFAKFDWIKLEDKEYGTLSIIADRYKRKAFDEHNSNDWKRSTLRTYLNTTFLAKLIQNGVKPGEILPIVRKLESEDGEEIIDTISLLTSEENEEYKDLLSPYDKYWWDLKPQSHYKGKTEEVKLIAAIEDTEWPFEHNSYLGVRPVCNFKSDTTVLVYDEYKDKEDQNNSTTEKIREWFIDRNLITADPKAQMLKLIEETGELAEGLAKNKPDQIEDSIGDIYVVLTGLALQLGLKIEDCIDTAYNEIKDRKGKMIDGVFVKEEDL